MHQSDHTAAEEGNRQVSRAIAIGGTVILGLASALMLANIPEEWTSTQPSIRNAGRTLYPPPPAVGTRLRMPPKDALERPIEAPCIVVSLPPCDSCAMRQVSLPDAHFAYPVVLVYPNGLKAARSHLPVGNRDYRFILNSKRGALPDVMHAWAPQAVALDGRGTVVQGASGPQEVTRRLKEFAR